MSPVAIPVRRSIRPFSMNRRQTIVVSARTSRNLAGDMRSMHSGLLVLWLELNCPLCRVNNPR